MSKSQSPALVGYVPGIWDVFHVGHLDFLRRAKSRCDRLVVGVLSDDLARSATGHDPRFPLADRLEALRSVRVVDQVLPQHSRNWFETWERTPFSILFRSPDGLMNAYAREIEAKLREVGTSVEDLSYTTLSQILGPDGPESADSARRQHGSLELSSPSAPSPFRILVVCTANLCRSPMAQQLLARRAMDAGLPWTVGSAGTNATAGQPMHPYALKALAGMGVADPNFVSQAVTPQLVAQQDLILTTTDEQRAWVVSENPKAANRVYVLKPFAHLVAAIPVEKPILPATAGQELLERAVRARSRVQPLRKDRDLADPVNRPQSEFEARVREIDRILASIVPSSRPDNSSPKTS